MIEGLSHITLIVRDLERMSQLLKAIFDAEEVYASGDDTHSIAQERFFLIGGIWLATMEGAPLSEQSYNHVAFKISEDDFDMYADRVRAAGVEMRIGRPRIEGEARSLYFHDHDNHLFELHTGTLDERLAAYTIADQ